MLSLPLSAESVVFHSISEALHAYLGQQSELPLVGWACPRAGCINANAHMDNPRKKRHIKAPGPRVLVLHLVRWGDHMAYLQHPVAPDETVRIGDATYSLRSVVSHEGFHRDGGHYVAMVKRNGKWWLCNDREVTEATTEQISSGCRQNSHGSVYIALYERLG